MSAISQFGLEGAFQWHVAPEIHVVDCRVHQVFEGFSSEPARLVAWAEKWLGQSAVAHTNGGLRLRLSDLTQGALAPGTLIAFAGLGGERPRGVSGLVDVVDRLLGPGGCPWDQAQTHASLTKHLVEECYELVDAIESGDEEKMLEELGDVLLQPVMHAQMEALAGRWDINVVAERITEKLVRRHPHVFAGLDVADEAEVLRNWDAIKAAERGPSSALDGPARSMPVLLLALEISRRAARQGFEWPDIDGVWAKLDEEAEELKTAADGEQEDELGDLLFTIVNLARWMDVDPERALRRQVARFSNRFHAMESAASVPLSELDAAGWNELWIAAKLRARDQLEGC